mmetsp:Transcript_53147/g.157101  ORF Transcript_53147/g.157101 Transcript_53147/m.157101 type:complete len:1306 (-) Transcript_53147:590-4507(-)
MQLFACPLAKSCRATRSPLRRRRASPGPATYRLVRSRLRARGARRRVDALQEARRLARRRAHQHGHARRRACAQQRLARCARAADGLDLDGRQVGELGHQLARDARHLRHVVLEAARDAVAHLEAARLALDRLCGAGGAHRQLAVVREARVHQRRVRRARRVRRRRRHRPRHHRCHRRHRRHRREGRVRRVRRDALLENRLRKGREARDLRRLAARDLQRDALERLQACDRADIGGRRRQLGLLDVCRAARRARHLLLVGDALPLVFGREDEDERRDECAARVLIGAFDLVVLRAQRGDRRLRRLRRARQRLLRSHRRRGRRARRDARRAPRRQKGREALGGEPRAEARHAPMVLRRLLVQVLVRPAPLGRVGHGRTFGELRLGLGRRRRSLEEAPPPRAVGRRRARHGAVGARLELQLDGVALLECAHRLDRQQRELARRAVRRRRRQQQPARREHDHLRRRDGRTHVQRLVHVDTVAQLQQHALRDRLRLGVGAQRVLRPVHHARRPHAVRLRRVAARLLEKVEGVGDALRGARRQVEHAGRRLDDGADDALADALDEARHALRLRALDRSRDQTREALHHAAPQPRRARHEPLHDVLRLGLHLLPFLHVVGVHREGARQPAEAARDLRRRLERAAEHRARERPRAVDHRLAKVLGPLEEGLARQQEEVLDARAEAAQEARRVAERVNLQQQLVDLPQQRVLVVVGDRVGELLRRLERVLEREPVQHERRAVEVGDDHLVAEDLVQHALAVHVRQVDLDRRQLEPLEVPVDRDRDRRRGHLAAAARHARVAHSRRLAVRALEGAAPVVEGALRVGALRAVGGGAPLRLLQEEGVVLAVLVYHRRLGEAQLHRELNERLDERLLDAQLELVDQHRRVREDMLVPEQRHLVGRAAAALGAAAHLGAALGVLLDDRQLHEGRALLLRARVHHRVLPVDEARADQHRGQLRVVRLVVEPDLADRQPEAVGERARAQLDREVGDAKVRELAHARAHEREADPLDLRQQVEVRLLRIGRLPVLRDVRDRQRARVAARAHAQQQLLRPPAQRRALAHLVEPHLDAQQLLRALVGAAPRADRAKLDDALARRLVPAVGHDRAGHEHPPAERHALLLHVERLGAPVVDDVRRRPPRAVGERHEHRRPAQRDLDHDRPLVDIVADAHLGPAVAHPPPPPHEREREHLGREGRVPVDRVLPALVVRLALDRRRVGPAPALLDPLPARGQLHRVDAVLEPALHPLVGPLAVEVGRPQVRRREVGHGRVPPLALGDDLEHLVGVAHAQQCLADLVDAEAAREGRAVVGLVGERDLH